MVMVEVVIESGGSTVMIRGYQDRDFDAIAEIYALSKLDELRFEVDRFELLPLKRDEKRYRATMESRIFVYDDGHVLGYGAVFKNEIRALFVHPRFRGKGVGKRLLDYLILQADAPTILYIAESNSPAKSLYQKYGFYITRAFETEYNGKPVLANKMVRGIFSR